MNGRIKDILNNLGFKNKKGSLILKVEYANDDPVLYKAYETEDSYSGLPVILIGEIDKDGDFTDESKNMELSSFILLLD